MKKIISTQGYTDGHYEAPNLNTAISERVDNRLTACYRQYYGDDIQVTPSLTYRLADGQVTTLELAYTTWPRSSTHSTFFQSVSRASCVLSMRHSPRTTPSIHPQAHTSCRFQTFPTIASQKEHSTYHQRQPAIPLSCKPSTYPPI